MWNECVKVGMKRLGLVKNNVLDCLRVDGLFGSCECGRGSKP